MVVHKSDSTTDLIECLKSLNHQTLPPAEIVLISDGDIPESIQDVINSEWDILLRYYMYSGTEKFPGALNLGLRKAKNSVVARMDPDDLCRPTRFQNQIPYYLKNRPIILGSSISEFDQKPGDLCRDRIVSENIEKHAAYLRNPVNHMTAILDRDFVLGIGGYKFVECFEDWHLWLRVIKSGGSIQNIDKVLVDVRVGNGFLSRRQGGRYALNELNAYLTFSRESLMPLGYILFGILARIPTRFLPPFVLKAFYYFSRK